MWKTLSDALKSIFFLHEKTQKNSSDIKDLQKEVQQLTVAVQMLIQELHHVRQEEKSEREKLALQLENELLRRFQNPN